MKFDLTRHHAFPAPAIRSIEVEVVRETGGRLSCSYTVTGDIAAIVLPPLMTADRADNLWTTTCFEAFVQPAGEIGYAEFNLSPSYCWAAYDFDSYRTGRRDTAVVAPPRIDMHVASDRLKLRARLRLPHRDAQASVEYDLFLGLSAVIEMRGGRKSYWALAHPASDRPDFHHGDCFAALLRAPAGP